MSQQNYKNHRRLILGHHGFSALAILAAIAGSIINYVNSADTNTYSASLLVLITVVMLFMWFYLRLFALKAQDRAIRAEENFRHYILTGKPFGKGLSIRQIIGLRFASDEEFPALADRAEKENLSETEIKKAIQNWKADTYRV
jgi:hypothetical protein